MSSLPLLNPFHWGYNGTVKQHIGEDGTVPLKLKQSNERISLQQFLSDNVPGLRDNAKFQLNPRLFTGILQTLYLSTADFSKKFPVFYGREIITYSDNGVSTADWVKTEWPQRYNFDPITGRFDREKFNEDERLTHPVDWPRLHPRTRYLNEQELQEVHEDSTRPLVIVMHGLAGGSHEPIIRSLTQELSQVSGGKFHVVVLNTRGCARSKITSPKLFSAFATSDLRELVKREKERNPTRKIFCVGFSFGATMLSNYLGEAGDDSLLDAAAVLCNPWDLVLSAHKMNDDFWSRTLFSKAIAQFLTRTVKVNMKELEYKEGEDEKSQYQPSVEHPSNKVFTKENLKKAYNFKSTLEFDSTYTAPGLGFNSALEYYHAAGSIHRLPSIRVPTLIINSKDDPVVGEASIPVKVAKENKNVILCETDLGGHLSYLDSNKDSWATKQISQFFDKFEELVE